MTVTTKESVRFDPTASEELQRLQFVLECCQVAFNKLALEDEGTIDPYDGKGGMPSNVAIAKMQLRVALSSLEYQVALTAAWRGAVMSTKSVTPILDRLDELEKAIERNQRLIDDIIGMIEARAGIKRRGPGHLTVVESP